MESLTVDDPEESIGEEIELTEEELFEELDMEIGHVEYTRKEPRKSAGEAQEPDLKLITPDASRKEVP